MRSPEPNVEPPPGATKPVRQVPLQLTLLTGPDGDQLRRRAPQGTPQQPRCPGRWEAHGSVPGGVSRLAVCPHAHHHSACVWVMRGPRSRPRPPRAASLTDLLLPGPRLTSVLGWKPVPRLTSLGETCPEFQGLAGGHGACCRPPPCLQAACVPDSGNPLLSGFPTEQHLRPHHAAL